MSRSRKKNPFAAICGGSSHYDKQLAARGVRRRQNQFLRTHRDPDAFIIPHRLECSHNEVYSWNRDGHQVYQGLDAGDWNAYQRVAQGLDRDCFSLRHYGTWPPVWYEHMMRK